MPYAPLNVPKPVAAGAVWIVDGPEIEFNWLGLSLPFPTRMTLVRLPSGVWIHSPTAPDPALLAAVRALGPVRWLVAPNTLHYWWIPDWKAAFPAAEVHASPGLERSAKRALPIDHVLGDAAPAAWSGEIDQLVVRGDLFTEACFFHRTTRTLVLTDLVANFEPRRIRRRRLRALLRLDGATDPDGKTPFDMRLSFLRHRRTLRESVLRMLAWNPERVILAHGRWYERDGAAELRRAFRWVL